MTRFADAVRQLLLQQARALWTQVNPEWVLGGGRVNLTSWANDEKVVAALVPYLLREWQTGLRAGAASMTRQRRPVDTRGLRQELVDEATEQVRRMLRETAKTTQDAINAEVRAARRKLRAKRPKPGALQGVLSEIQTQLLDSSRAEKIAATETDMAKNGGRLLVIKEGDAPYKRWVTVGPRICPACRRLNGKIVPVADPFFVDPKGGPYAVKMAPPYHPNCGCRVEAAWNQAGK